MSQATLDLATSVVLGTSNGATPVPFVFTVTRSGDTSVAATVDWSVPYSGYLPQRFFADGLLPSGVVSFAPGETTQQITVDVVADYNQVGWFYSEGFAVTLASTSPDVVVGNATERGIILENYGDNTVIYANLISSDRLNEGNSGATPFVFVVQRSGTLDSAASVDWTVTGSGSTPANAADFVGGVAPSGTVSFAPGQGFAYITVDVQGDTAVESDENFAVLLSNPVNTGLGAQPITAPGTILNDDLPAGGIVYLGSSVSHDEGNSGSTPFVYRVYREGDTSTSATVTWSVVGSSLGGNYPAVAAAADATDFTGGVLPSGTVTFAPGDTYESFTINVAGDNVIEPTEGFLVSLDSASGTTLGDPFGKNISTSGTIVNDDSRVTVYPKTGVSTFFEGNSGTTPVVLLVSRSGSTDAASWVTWDVTGYGPAQFNGADFVGGVLPSGTVSFAVGVASVELTLLVAGDTMVEPDEGFRLNLLEAGPGLTIGAGSTVSPTQGDESSFTALVLNDDRTVSITADTPSQAEGNSGSTPFVFTLTRTAISHEPNSYNTIVWAVTGTGDHPADAADFVGGVLPSGVATFDPYVMTQTITVNVAGDTAAEFDEQFQVALSHPGYTMTIDPTAGTATETIVNDDGTPTGTINLAGNEVRHTEGNTGATAYVFNLNRTGDTSGTATVAYTVTGEPNLINGGKYYPTTAADAADFVGGVLPSGVVTFAAGQTTQAITVEVQGDSQVEPDETFLVSLADPTGATIGPIPTMVGSIFNDDSYVIISDTIPSTASSGYEGNGAGVAIFNLSRVGGDTGDATVVYTITGTGPNPAPASAFAGGVYPTGTLTLAAGVGSEYVTIALQGDSIPAPDETFTITLSDPSPGLSLSADPQQPTSASYTILNDDSAISIAATDAVKAEGNSGTTPYVFTVTRTPISGPALTPAISLHWASGTYGSPTVNAADFPGGVGPSGIISFAAGQLSQTITVDIVGDTTPEPDETFRVVIYGAPAGSTITTAQAIGTILNDDTNFSIAATTPSQYEGDSGTTPYVFTISRAIGAGYAGTDSVGWALVGAAGGNSAGVNDFAPGQAMSGRVTFAPGETSQQVTVLVQGDTLVEPDEGFRMLLQGASAGTRITTGSATATILNDDTGIAVAALDAVKDEGNSGQTPFTFTVTRTGLLGAGDSVAWSVIGAAGNSANPADFLGGVAPSGTISFAAGQASAIVTVEVQGDQVVEPDEGFQIALGAAHAGAGNAPVHITTARAQGTILNDDTGFSIAAINPVQNEGNSGATNFVFTVTRTGTLAATDSVGWATTGLAPHSVGPADFVAGSPLAGTLVFAPGQATADITVSVQGDTQVEPDEMFRVLLRNASPGASITGNHADATIVNDDLLPSSAPLAPQADVAPSGAVGATDPYATPPQPVPLVTWPSG